MDEIITKKDIKEILEEQNRKYMVVIEDLNRKFDAFGESLDYIRERQDILEKKVDAIEEIVGELLVDMKWAKQEIAEIKNKLDGKIDRYEYEKLETRVTRLENYVKKYLVKV
jgi:hypothetical protein